MICVLSSVFGLEWLESGILFGWVLNTKTNLAELLQSHKTPPLLARPSPACFNRSTSAEFGSIASVEAWIVPVLPASPVLAA